MYFFEIRQTLRWALVPPVNPSLRFHSCQTHTTGTSNPESIQKMIKLFQTAQKIDSFEEGHLFIIIAPFRNFVPSTFNIFESHAPTHAMGSPRLVLLCLIV
jgi:hypothetical protein